MIDEKQLQLFIITPNSAPIRALDRNAAAPIFYHDSPTDARAVQSLVREIQNWAEVSPWWSVFGRVIELVSAMWYWFPPDKPPRALIWTTDALIKCGNGAPAAMQEGIKTVKSVSASLPLGAVVVCLLVPDDFTDAWNSALYRSGIDYIVRQKDLRHETKRVVQEIQARLGLLRRAGDIKSRDVKVASGYFIVAFAAIPFLARSADLFAARFWTAMGLRFDHTSEWCGLIYGAQIGVVTCVLWRFRDQIGRLLSGIKSSKFVHRYVLTNFTLILAFAIAGLMTTIIHSWLGRGR